MADHRELVISTDAIHKLHRAGQLDQFRVCITLKSGHREAGGHIGQHTYIACMLPQLSHVLAAQACYGCLLRKDI